MGTGITDSQIRAYARLTSHLDLIERGGPTDRNFVDQYDAALDHLERGGLDLTEYRISLNELTTNPRRTGGTPMVSKPRALSQLKTVLSYFQLKRDILDQSKKQNVDESELIGFDLPE